MPFRLLGLVVDPNRASEFCGHTFAHYVAAGADVTLAFVAGRELSMADARLTMEQIGVRNAVLLGLARDEVSGEALAPLLADLIGAVSPQVVVIDGGDEALSRAAAGAFVAARRRLRGIPGGPAKLYIRATGTQPHDEVTTAVDPGRGRRELFARVYPTPWVTGLLERDLFSGLPAEPGPSLERLAS